MFRKLLFAGIAIALFASCSKSTKCGERACDLSFSYITVKFVYGEDKGVTLRKYSVVNQRTKDTLRSAAGISIDLITGAYFVADDSHKDQLSAEGDDLLVSGTDSTGVTKTGIFKISGGKCVCHITKISGPEKIAFN